MYVCISCMCIYSRLLFKISHFAFSQYPTAETYLHDFALRRRFLLLHSSFSSHFAPQGQNWGDAISHFR